MQGTRNYLTIFVFFSFFLFIILSENRVNASVFDNIFVQGKGFEHEFSHKPVEELRVVYFVFYRSSSFKCLFSTYLSAISAATLTTTKIIAPNIVYCLIIAISAVMITTYSSVFVIYLFSLYFILFFTSLKPTISKQILVYKSRC
jgi:hypothetical protein